MLRWHRPDEVVIRMYFDGFLDGDTRAGVGAQSRQGASSKSGASRNAKPPRPHGRRCCASTPTTARSRRHRRAGATDRRSPQRRCSTSCSRSTGARQKGCRGTWPATTSTPATPHGRRRSPAPAEQVAACRGLIRHLDTGGRGPPHGRSARHRLHDQDHPRDARSPTITGCHVQLGPMGALRRAGRCALSWASSTWRSRSTAQRSACAT